MKHNNVFKRGILKIIYRIKVNFIKMVLTKYLGVAAMIALLVAPLKSADLEFIVRESGTHAPLTHSTVILEGLFSGEYLLQETGESNSTTFENVQDNEFYDYTIFHNGHHPFGDGSVYTNSNQTITQELEPYNEWEWPDYLVLGPEGLSLTFSSSGEDVYYDSGDDFNYLIFIQNISENPVNLESSQINAGVYDSNDQPVMIGDAIWGSPNEEITYDVTFDTNPNIGWLSYSAAGNNVQACIGNATDVTFNGTTYELGPGEQVCQNIQTQDNQVPEGINGSFHVNVSIGALNFTSRDFYVGPVSTKPDSRPGNLEKIAYQGSPNPTNGLFRIPNSENKKIEIYNLKGKLVDYQRSGENFYINSSSGVYFVRIGDKGDEKTIKQTIIK